MRNRYLLLSLSLALVVCAGCSHKFSVSSKHSASEMPESAVDTFARVAGGIQSDRGTVFPAEQMIDLIWKRARIQMNYLEGIDIFRDKTVSLTMDAPEGGTSEVATVDAPFYQSFGEEQGSVYKPARVFRSGRLGNMTLVSGRETGDDDEVVTTSRMEFEVDGAIDYAQTAWHQQATVESTATGRTVTYSYQSQPVMWVKIDEGGKIATESERKETIDRGKGWHVSGRSARTVQLKGRVSLYRPSRGAVEPAVADSSSETDETKVVGDNSTRIIRRVTVDTSSDSPDPQLTKKTKTVRIWQREELTHVPTGKTLKVDQLDHETVTVTYVASDNAHLSADLVNYEETKKSTETTVFMYKDKEGTYDTVSEEWVYRYTDNPFTRHDVERWKSTHRTSKTSFEEGLQVKSHDTGEIWLTDKMEPDPDVTELPFEIDMRVMLGDSLSVDMFGADFSGKQTREESVREFSVEVAIGGTTIKADGEITTAGSGIAFRDTQSFNNGTEPMGSVKVKVGDGKWTMSAEEFAQRLAGYLPLEGAYGKREYVDPEVRRAREKLLRERERLQGRTPDYMDEAKEAKKEAPRQAAQPPEPKREEPRWAEPKKEEAKPAEAKPAEPKPEEPRRAEESK